MQGDRRFCYIFGHGVCRGEADEDSLTSLAMEFCREAAEG